MRGLLLGAGLVLAACGQAAAQQSFSQQGLAPQGPYQGSTPLSLDGPAPPQNLPSTGATADDIATALKAAAALGVQQQKAATAAAAGEIFGAAEAAAQGTQTRTNPFQSPMRAAAGEDLVLQSQPVDAEKVVVREDEEGLISLMVREGSLRQVVSMIAKTQKLNLVFAGPNDTMVTASFEKQPWQTVLDSLLSASGHTWSKQGEVIFISSLDNADFLPPDAEGRTIQVYDLDFAAALDMNQTIAGGLLSPAGKSWIVQTNPADNRRTKEAVAVLDYPQNQRRIAEYISQADVPPRQVYIEAHILQVELTDDCRNGINFKNLAGWSSADVTLGTQGFANQANSPSFLVNIDGVGLDGLIELLQTTNDVKTLASPEIHAVSGQESHIQIGERLGYRVTTTTQTSSLESVQMLDVGVVLRVTPRITRDGRVLMRIMPKVSTGVVSPDTGLPSEKTTEVETDVMLCSGQGMLIGGLIQETDSNIQSKIPFIGDIPYAGVLFQKRNVLKTRKEIIVTLQPFILPYPEEIQAKHAERFQRTVEPLTQGAICSFPRPYEPQMNDPLQPWIKEQKKKAARQYKTAPQVVVDSDPPPAYEESYDPAYDEGGEMMPVPAAEPEPEVVEPGMVDPQASEPEYRGLKNVSFEQ